MYRHCIFLLPEFWLKRATETRGFNLTDSTKRFTLRLVWDDRRVHQDHTRWLQIRRSTMMFARTLRRATFSSWSAPACLWVRPGAIPWHPGRDYWNTGRSSAVKSVPCPTIGLRRSRPTWLPATWTTYSPSRRSSPASWARRRAESIADGCVRPSEDSVPPAGTCSRRCAT